MATCDIDQLVADACTNGFSCSIESQQRAIMLQLLCDLAAQGGGGCFQCSSGSGAPSVEPTNASQPASYQDTASGFSYRWDIGDQSWVPVPKVYRAIISQEDVGIPTAVVLENTLGTVTYARSGPGVYTANSAALFTDNKTYAIVGMTSPVTMAAVIHFSNAAIGIETANTSGQADALLFRAPFEILVYP